jgi:RecQ-mediated genome instability protein 1
MDEIIANVEEHLLRSDFRDSMLPGTGFPANLADLENTRLTGPPILVEIVQMTEIGHSAFNLMSVRQTRIDRADLAGLERGDEDEDRYEDPDDEAPIPKYPRSMLKLFLSDGTVTIPAIEYRKLPQLVLGETPLGRKVLGHFLLTFPVFISYCPYHCTCILSSYTLAILFYLFTPFRCFSKTSLFDEEWPSSNHKTLRLKDTIQKEE